MGIPSYYKKLTDSIPGLIRKSKPCTINWLWMDFNCLIYHTLGNPNMTEFTPHNISQWENTFIESVVSNCLSVVKEVSPDTGVYIAIDGVVPMAKMKQQRLRRFKSAWEHSIKGEAVRWDTNAITPGTVFMDKLKTQLEIMIRKQKRSVKWILSAADEPGEGEHKIMAQWRRGCYKGNFAIYGLDADLILLSLLTREVVREIDDKLIGDIWLFREDIENGEIIRDELGNDTYTWFSIDLLRKCLVETGELGDEKTFLYSYICAMTMLGNDFLPSSLSFKIRDNGHDILQDIIIKNSIKLIRGKDVNIKECIRLISIFSDLEEEWMVKNIGNKVKAAKRFASENTDTIVEVGNPLYPLINVEEKELLHWVSENRYEGLNPNWKQIYLDKWFPNSSRSSSIIEYCREYLKGIHWVWNYYYGNTEAVSYDWYYPHSLPPLWCWIKDMYAHCKDDVLQYLKTGEILSVNEISPQDQLSLVLPLQSWNLIRSSEHKLLPMKASWLFPEKFGFFTAGKRWFWECEPEIPIPSIRQIKAIVQDIKS
jgi:5'-3' exonuclease